MNIKLSIILTVYNKEPFLRRSFETLLAQKDTEEGDFEVLVVNDGSTDESASIIDEYERKYPHVHVLTQENQGLSMARNNGTFVAKGNYVWYVDADDAISLNSVRMICDAMETKPDLIPIYAKTHGINTIRNQIPINATNGKDVLLSNNWEHCGVFWVMKKNFLLDNGLSFMPGIYHEDAEFTPRMLYLAKSTIVIPQVLYTVYREANSITQVPRPKRAYDSITVAERLNRFTIANNECGTSIGWILDHNTAVIINSAFSVMTKNSISEQQEFNSFMQDKRDLIRPLKAAKGKFRIEAFLFRVFPRKWMIIYKSMKFFG